MSSTSAPFGFRPSFHNSGEIKPKAYTIATGTPVDIFKGDPVKLTTSGYVTLATTDGARASSKAGVSALGVFAGVEYIDSLGKPTVSPYWPSGTTATNIVAYVYDDPEIIYEVQFTNPSSGSATQTYIGAQFDWETSVAGGSTFTGVSSAFIATEQTSGAGNWQITGYANYISDSATDAYIVVNVRLNEAQYKATVNVIS